MAQDKTSNIKDELTLCYMLSRPVTGTDVFVLVDVALFVLVDVALFRPGRCRSLRPGRCHWCLVLVLASRGGIEKR